MYSDNASEGASPFSGIKIRPAHLPLEPKLISFE